MYIHTPLLGHCYERLVNNHLNKEQRDLYKFKTLFFTIAGHTARSDPSNRVLELGCRRILHSCAACPIDGFKCLEHVGIACLVKCCIHEKRTSSFEYIAGW